MVERKKYLEKHKYKIYQGNDGKWYTRIPDESKSDKRRQISRKTEQELKEAIIAHYKELESNPTFEELFNGWNRYRLDMGKISMATYSRNKQIFNRFCAGDFSKKKIKDTETYEIQDYLESQITKYNLTAKSFNNLKSLFRGLLKRSKKLKYITYNVEELFQDLDISDRCFKRRQIDNDKEIFYDDEMADILSYCKEHSVNDPRYLGIALFFIAGMRIGEVVALKHEDINHISNTIKVQRTETRYRDLDNKYVYAVKDKPKTEAGIRTVVIPTNYLWVLERLKYASPDNEYVFTNEKGRLHTNSLRKLLTQICDKIGISRKSPHKARKTYGSILLDNHVDNNLITRQMGHTEILTTERFYHKDRKYDNEKQKIIDAIPQFS